MAYARGYADAEEKHTNACGQTEYKVQGGVIVGERGNPAPPTYVDTDLASLETRHARSFVERDRAMLGAPTATGRVSGLSPTVSNEPRGAPSDLAATVFGVDVEVDRDARTRNYILSVTVTRRMTSPEAYPGSTTETASRRTAHTTFTEEALHLANPTGSDLAHQYAVLADSLRGFIPARELYRLMRLTTQYVPSQVSVALRTGLEYAYTQAVARTQETQVG